MKQEISGRSSTILTRITNSPSPSTRTLTFREKGTIKENICNYDQRRLLLFDESKVFDTLIDNGLFPEFSNSFLVLLGKEES